MVKPRQNGLAGRMREAVTFQARGLDANGDRLGAWEDQFTVPAQVTHQAVKRAAQAEIIADDRRVGIQPIDVTTRLTILTANIDTDWRVVWLGWAFDVTLMTADPESAVVTVLAIRSRAGDTPP